jgi:hypothetical protein
LQTYDTARREVECQQTMYLIVLWKMLTKLGTITTSGTSRLIFSLCWRYLPGALIGRDIVLLIARRKFGRSLSSSSQF